MQEKSMSGLKGTGWELLIERLAMHSRGEHRRTYGRYALFIDGVRVGIDGFMCEPHGPGDNQTPENGKRVEPSRYPVFTHFGRYRTIGYAGDDAPPGADSMPAIRLEETGARTDILIHPAYPAKPYLASIGCLNPAAVLTPDDDNDFWESRRRTIEIIESLRAFSPASFIADESVKIPDAVVIIEGEP
jgi:hypothetical protein